VATKLTRMPTGAKRFWAVADFFRKAGRPWSPSTVGYELWREVEADGTMWSVCMKVHAVPARRGPDGPLQFRASITLWPARASAGSRQVGAAAEWPEEVKRHLERAGYRGSWTKSPDGVFGDFWKDLAGPAAVRREAKLLLGLELPARAPATEAQARGGRSSRRANRRARADQGPHRDQDPHRE